MTDEGYENSHNGRDSIADIPAEVVGKYHLDQLPFDAALATPAQLMDLTGRRVLVTGGGGLALGGALVERFAAAGADVGFVDIDGSAAERSATRAKELWGTNVIPLEADITNWVSASAVVQEAIDRLGALEILVNNAGGVLGLHGPFSQQGSDGIQRI